MAVKLKATKRENLTKSATKQIRLNGQVPAVVYGKEKESKNVTVDSIDLLKTVRDEGRNAIISLDVENDNLVNVMLHDYQIDPIKDQLLHADFYIVNMSEEMDVAVPLRLEGEAQGAKSGGVLQQPFFELQVRAKPGNFPEEITVDVSALDVGDSITVSDIASGAKYELLDDPEATVVTVLPPTKEEVSEADENAEPELVGAKKEDKNGTEEK
ncbi:50S ribosomal protein L25/general stress protein Ctc [Oceanobacillus saliphilus]|uniref:50S ribosomal protein L25/general stress protein Ctc n=1 Tax=Oceanobacillus saliphilus TaxID=2925834 RepID=UPI00201D680D|nr:50S ribosomal protein L25/general stress protein Ctc [Oceanobacillus saliphilus]